MKVIDEIRADLRRFEQPYWRTLLVEPQSRWLALYRLADGSRGARRSLLGLAVRSYGRRFGYSIPLGVLGQALKLPHVGTIAVNGASRIGSNCQLLQGVTLGGTSAGAPAIGDDVFIGPNVTVIGPVVVGNGAVLMAGANIRRDVPAGVSRGPADDAVDRRSP